MAFTELELRIIHNFYESKDKGLTKGNDGVEGWEDELEVECGKIQIHRYFYKNGNLETKEQIVTEEYEW